MRINFRALLRFLVYPPVFFTVTVIWLLGCLIIQDWVREGKCADRCAANGYGIKTVTHSHCVCNTLTKVIDEENEKP